jgi:hypothetical protein
MTATTGRVSGAPFKDRARLGEDDVLYVPIALATGGTLDAVWYPGTNDDSAPVEGDTVTLIRIGGFYAATGGKGAEPLTEPGERELFSRNADREKVARVFLKADGEVVIESMKGESSVTLTPDGDIFLNSQKSKLVLRANGKYYLGNGSDDLLAALVKTIDDIINIKTIGPPPKHDVSPDDKAKLKQDQETLKSFMDSEG